MKTNKKSTIKILGASKKENIEITKEFNQFRKGLRKKLKAVDNRSGIDLNNIDSLFVV
jgi:hypothetical protein